MAKTFKALTDLADWSAPSSTSAASTTESVPDSGTGEPTRGQEVATKQESDHRDDISKLQLRELHYNIQIILPESRDVAVYDAIFESLRRHLL
jgi:hypothetical protein